MVAYVGSFFRSDTHILIAKETFQSCEMGIVQPGGNVCSTEVLEPFGNAPARLQWLFKNGRIFSFLSSGSSTVAHIIN